MAAAKTVLAAAILALGFSCPARNPELAILFYFGLELGDCDCYMVYDPTVIDHECYIEYCYYWDTCQWETYDYSCY